MPREKIPPFVKLPWCVLRDRSLTPSDVRMYCALVARAWKTGVAWASYQTLANDIGVARSTAIRQVSRLCARGFILRVPRARKGKKTKERDTSLHTLVALDRIYQPAELFPSMKEKEAAPLPYGVVPKAPPGVDPPAIPQVDPNGPPGRPISATSPTGATTQRPLKPTIQGPSNGVVAQMGQEEDVYTRSTPGGRSERRVEGASFPPGDGNGQVDDEAARRRQQHARDDETFRPEYSGSHMLPASEQPRTTYPEHYAAALKAFEWELAGWNINGQAVQVSMFKARLESEKSVAMTVLAHMFDASSFADMVKRWSSAEEASSEGYDKARLSVGESVSIEGPEPAGLGE